MEKVFNDSFVDKLRVLDMELSEYQIKQFYEYYEMIIECNKVMNLTTITDMEDVIVKHFIDSLSIVKSKMKLEVPCRNTSKSIRPTNLENSSIIDVGTGAGFPGIPLKIAFPELQVVLLDSLNKRVKFLDHVIQKLELKDITAIHGRAEDLGRDLKHREKYDYCVSRAVANLASLSEYCLPFVKVGGYFISYKSGNMEEELNSSKGAIKKLSGKTSDVFTFLLPGTDMERTLVVVNKQGIIKSDYPRKAGLPSKEPLK